MEQYRTKQIKRALSKVSKISEKRVAQEICGLMGKDGDYYVVQECENISKDPRQFFEVDPLQFLLFKNEYKPIAIFHSHICGNEEASDFDIQMSENSCIPFMIYSLNTKKINLYIPEYSDADEDSIQKIIQKI